MKKFKSLMLLAAMFATSVSVSAQKVLLDEGFETDYVRASEEDTPFSRPVASGEGWTTVDTYAGETPQYKWTNYYYEKGTISGKHVAYCDGQMFSGADGAGPREEILLTPELDLDDTYQLSFDDILHSESRRPERERSDQLCGLADTVKQARPQRMEGPEGEDRLCVQDAHHQFKLHGIGQRACEAVHSSHYTSGQAQPYEL